MSTRQDRPDCKICWKVCGLTRVEDVQSARAAGADWFGVIGYPQSPRAVACGQWPELLAAIPAGRAVYVDVLPEIEQLQAAQQAGFARWQVHFPLQEGALNKLAKLVDALGTDALWLAPRLSTAADFSSTLAERAETFLLDGLAADKYGGTGRCIDPQLFRSVAAGFPQKNFILAGGLAAENIRGMVKSTGARAVDVNSGVETAPGVKSAEKLQAVARELEILQGELVAQSMGGIS